MCQCYQKKFIFLYTTVHVFPSSTCSGCNCYTGHTEPTTRWQFRPNEFHSRGACIEPALRIALDKNYTRHWRLCSPVLGELFGLLSHCIGSCVDLRKLAAAVVHTWNIDASVTRSLRDACCNHERKCSFAPWCCNCRTGTGARYFWFGRTASCPCGFGG